METSGKNGEACWRLAWRCPGKNHSSRRLRVGSSGGDQSKPSSSTALDRTRKRSASMPELDALGGVVRRAWQLLRIWSRQWQAVVHVAVIASTKWDKIACSRRGTLVWVGEENGRNLSMGREWGTRGHSQRGDIPSQWVLFERGRRPSMKHTRRACQRCVGEPCTSDNNGTAFEKCRRNLLWIESCRIAAGKSGRPAAANAEPSRKRSRSAAMARSTGKASSLIERRSCSHRWRRRNLRILWQMPALYIQMPAHSGRLWWASMP